MRARGRRRRNPETPVRAVYLFGGAAPIAPLCNRFFLAEASPLDHVVRRRDRVAAAGVEIEVIDLASHSPAQVGFLVAGVLFAANSSQDRVFWAIIPYHTW